MLLLLLPFVVSVYSQQAGTLQAEVHPSLTWETCTAPDVCTTVFGSVTLDADWRWTHNVGGESNCYTGNTWNTTLCPNPVACAQNCALEGATYSSFGVTTSGNALQLNFENSASSDTGSRVYLMANATEYQTFNLLNKEIAFDIDVSTLDCGYSSGLYFVAMDADGGSAKHPVNTAGAKYGTGYCDASCPRDVKWINGEANIDEWTPTAGDTLDTEQAGHGLWGSCCPEVDVWTSNQVSTSLAVHPCLSVNQTICTNTLNGCGGPNSTSGTCDYDGCDFNPYQLGNKTFFGPGLTIDTTKVFTVVTQFIGNPLTEINRFYIQYGVTTPNPASEIISVKGNSITPAFCTEELAAFKEVNSFGDFGGFASITAAFTKGMVLAFAVEGNYFGNGTQWLDGTYPFGIPATVEGAVRGPCAVNEASTDPVGNNAGATFSNIRIGAINSTTYGDGIVPGR